MAKALGDSNNKRKECYFMEKKEEEVGRGYFEQKSIEEKREFKKMNSLAKLLHSVLGKRYNVYLFLLEPIIDYPFLLILLLGSVIDRASCNCHQVVLHESSPFWPLSSVLVKFSFILTILNKY